MMNVVLRIFALAGIICLSPLIFLASILVFIEDGLPIFFIQNRVGKDEKLFKLFKIRTMKNKTPNLGTHEVNIKHFLNTGKILRNLKIDELPQIINYLMGDINLVGPRPCLPNQEKLLNFRKENNVFTQKPGITGLGQILGFDMSNPELLSKIDRLYINERTNLLGFKILIATFIKHYRKNIYNQFKEPIKSIKEKSNV